MNTKVATRAVVILFTLAAACAPADDADVIPAEEQVTPAPTAAVVAPPELQAAAEQFAAAWNQDDPAVVAAFFTENATVIADDTATYTGRQDIQDRWLAPGVEAITTLESEIETWDRVGEDYRVVGTFTYTAALPDGTTMQESGRFTNVWTRAADGQWRVSSMTSNADAPAEAAAPSQP